MRSLVEYAHRWMCVYVCMYVLESKNVCVSLFCPHRQVHTRERVITQISPRHGMEGRDVTVI